LMIALAMIVCIVLGHRASEMPAMFHNSNDHLAPFFAVFRTTVVSLRLRPTIVGRHPL
jgi:hypothetical protein